jgi:transcriptional regulator with XRE-family HTH domain
MSTRRQRAKLSAATTGRRLKQAREQAGVTAQELADYLGVDISTVFRYESGQIPLTPCQNCVLKEWRLTAIGKLLKIDAASLL